MDVGPLGPPPDPDGIWMRTEPSSGSWKAPPNLYQVPADMWFHGDAVTVTDEAAAEYRSRFGRMITAMAGVPPLILSEEPGRTVLAPWQWDWATQRGAERLASEQDKIDAYFRGEPPPDTLAQARRKWLDGQAGLSEFLAAVDRADLAELDRLPGASWRGPWWRRVLLRVIQAFAGRRRVV